MYFHNMTNTQLLTWIDAHNLVDGETYWDSIPSDPTYDEDCTDEEEREYRDELEGMAEELADARSLK